MAFGGIAAAFAFENGKFSDLMQWRSAMLILCGTAGVVLVSTPLRIVQDALTAAKQVWTETPPNTTATLETLSVMAKKAKRLGLVSLEHDMKRLSVPLLIRGLRLATDGLPAADVLQTMRLEVKLNARRLYRQAHVFEAAGGYAPTLGILGAVLGLIGVMNHLDQIAMVGHGIAEAFASTVYGLALANLVLHPIAGRLRCTAAQWLEAQEMLIDGVAMLMDGAHAIVVEERLAPYIGEAGETQAKMRLPSRAMPISLAKGA